MSKIGDVEYHTYGKSIAEVCGFFKRMGYDTDSEILKRESASGNDVIVRLTVKDFDPFKIGAANVRRLNELPFF